MGNTCGCNQETLLLDRNSEVDCSVQEKRDVSKQLGEHRALQSTHADDEQSQAQYTDMKSMQSPTHSLNPSETAASLFAADSEKFLKQDIGTNEAKTLASEETIKTDA